MFEPWKKPKQKTLITIITVDVDDSNNGLKISNDIYPSSQKKTYIYIYIYRFEGAHGPTVKPPSLAGSATKLPCSTAMLGSPWGQPSYGPLNHIHLMSDSD